MEPASQSRIRLLLGDGQNLVLTGLERLFEEADDIEIVGRTTSGRHALGLLLDQPPDIALLDIDLEEISAIAILQELHRRESRPPIIVLSSHTDSAHVQQAILAGARGYVLKRGTSANLLHAIRSVFAGGMYLDAEVAEACLSTPPARDDGAGTHKMRPLSRREEDIIRLIALGFTAKEIGGQLGINARSVETHKARAMVKLGLRSRVKIVRYAAQRGWFHEI